MATNIFFRATSVLSLGFALAQPAFAQEVAIGEIVVTALKRSESLQDIPAAVSAISGEELQSRGLNNIQDLAQAVPSLNFGEHAGATMLTIRGVGSTVDSGVTEPTVATYIDGVFMPRATMGYVRAVDLDRIEVLRGPQGTLYGRNATGGAINFISAAPSKTLTAGVNLSAGSRKAFGVSGFVSGPLSDTASLRVSGGHDEDDGFVRHLSNGNRVGATNVDYVRAALRFEPSSDFSLDLSARYEALDGSNAYQQQITPNWLPAPQTTKPNTIYGDSPYRNQFKTFVLAGTINWNISDAVSLKSITSYVDHKSRIDFDADGTDLPIAYVPNWQRPSESFGQEINLIGETGALEWILGTYYFQEKAGNSLPVGFGAFLAPIIGVPAGTITYQSVDTKTRSFAAFADMTYSLSDQLRLNLGLRYNYEKKNFRQDAGLIFPGNTVLRSVDNFRDSDTTNRVLPKVNVQYDLSDYVNTYAQWSKGFKSGGENLPGSNAEFVGALGLYLPESLDAFEIGVKTQTADRRLTANFAAFYYDYSNLQLTISLPPASTAVQNAPARVYGLEGEVNYRLSDAFRINASGSWLHARFTDFFTRDPAQPALGLQNLKGQPLPHAPSFSGNLGAEYRAQVQAGPIASLTLRGDLFYSSDVVLRHFGTTNEVQGDYATLNLSATIAGKDDRMKLRLFVNNVTNTTYLQNATYIELAAGYLGNYAPPRTWGAAVSYRY